MHNYSMKAPATSASIPPETRVATPALVVGTALSEAEELAVEEAELELSEVWLADELAEVLPVVLAEVLEAVVMVVGELVLAEEEEVEEEEEEEEVDSEVVVGVEELVDSAVEEEEEVELAVVETVTVAPSTVKRPMKL
jgi:hypothetical protein